MTDLAIPGLRRLDFTTENARARVRARYRAELRFKAYGLIAIGLTTLFIFAVLADITVRGLPGVHPVSARARCEGRAERSRPAEHARSRGHPRRRLRGLGAQHPSPDVPRRDGPGGPSAARRARLVRRARPAARTGGRRPLIDRPDHQSAAAPVRRRRPLPQGARHIDQPHCGPRRRHAERDDGRDHDPIVGERLRRRPGKSETRFVDAGARLACGGRGFAPQRPPGRGLQGRRHAPVGRGAGCGRHSADRDAGEPVRQLSRRGRNIGSAGK